ncbi:RraA family protein [Dactylosporangium sp. CA-092794]|uniref:RraA family protein n=1 Tax=Dactylosporangium sp. CA-092794 TaxID=3239929 RepID=UPI003D91B708
MRDVVAALGEFSTPTLSDALDRLGIAGQVFGIHPLSHTFRLAGRAFTVQYQPVDVDGGTVGDYIEQVTPGDVVVIDNAGRTDATVWGDILTLVAAQRGIGGTVIDGVCRDRRRSRELDYPVFARGNWMRTGKDRVQMVATQVPVTVGLVRVRPGDILVGDEDGVVAVPAERAEDVLRVAGEIEAKEDRIRAEVESGTPLSQARAAAGYHTLQTRSAASDTP